LIELEVPTLSESDAIKIIDWMARSLSVCPRTY
jgi:hypothetical protein